MSGPSSCEAYPRRWLRKAFCAGATKRAGERVAVVRKEGAAVRRAREKLREADAIVVVFAVWLYVCVDKARVDNAQLVGAGKETKERAREGATAGNKRIRAHGASS